MMSPTSYPHDPHVEVREKLDEEIDQLETRLVKLKLTRNDLAPITRLHPEILQEIFFLAHYSSERKGKVSLLITWVSHKWRELAHNTSALWSQIDFKHPEWVEVALSRTKHRELEITLDGTARRIKHSLIPLIPLTLGNLSRTRKLKIASRYARTAIPAETPEWLNPAPRLVDLHLRGLTLPPNLFLGTVPCLKSLYLYSCTIDWGNLPITRGLKKLSLLYPHSNSVPNVNSIIKIFDIIGTDLEELQLQGVFNETPDATPTISTTRFQFTKLKLIKLLGDVELDHYAQLFDCLALPPRLDIEIGASEWGQSNLVPSLISSRNIEKWPMDYLEIKVENRHVCLRIAEDISKLDAPMIEPDGSQNHIQLDISAVDDQPQFLHVLNLLPIHPIEKVFFVGGYRELQNTTILDYIAKLMTVRELGIELPFLTTFMSSTTVQGGELQIAVGEGTPDESGGVRDTKVDTPLAQETNSFYGLRDLKIYGELQYSWKLTCQDARNIQTWLERRNRNDLRLEKLTISGLTTPPISWLIGVFDGLVGEFQTNDLVEIEDADTGPEVMQVT
ncbi:hypothetical protein BDN72DRAFT_965972 [Pluteus cervinus]|uniref:Uncharacterized protein n=1 Tax=Pluteus cervinus TaxID=181527 RepID=A0ACD3A4A5_9AGAR|nr:hypothetical protein BDN72DRAFT_965972 [Pluteus cervinus]